MSFHEPMPPNTHAHCAAAKRSSAYGGRNDDGARSYPFQSLRLPLSRSQGRSKGLGEHVQPVPASKFSDGHQNGGEAVLQFGRVDLESREWRLVGRDPSVGHPPNPLVRPSLVTYVPAAVPEIRRVRLGRLDEPA